MKRFLVAFAVTALFAGVAFAQEADIGYYANEIGLYITETPADAADSQLTIGGFGLYSAFLVVSNPVDAGTGVPIENVGGFELTMLLPASIQFNAVNYPAGVLDLNPNPEHFYCSGSIPVGGGLCTLAEVVFLNFGDLTPGGVRIVPFDAGPQSIPGHMAITDADRAFALSTAFPMSGSYDDPVMGINMAVVPTEDVSWGEVKSLFQ
ncbi:MAG: hypothetical protein GY838_18415 [bacterium]|nr:hypothetical protein [bacterium]